MITIKCGKIVKKPCIFTDFCPITSLVYFDVTVVISLVIQFDKFFHLVVIDLHDLICIFMNMNENLNK